MANNGEGGTFPTKLVGSLALLLLLVIFWGLNRDRVKVNFFGYHSNTRTWVALVISGLIGFLAGILVARHRD
jgi:uncharacterized integral membrane protein